MDEDIKKEIRKFALQNAVEHDGKTNEKIVLSKILGSRAELRKNVKDVIGECSNIVAEVNSYFIKSNKSLKLKLNILSY